MQIPGYYNENLVDAVDICDPVDVALMTDVDTSIVQDEMTEEDIEMMMEEIEDGIDIDENDDMYETSVDPLDVEIDEEIESEYDLSDENGELVDIVDEEVGY